MKKFISENWYKLMIGSSMLMASFGFLVNSFTSSQASNFSLLNPNSAPSLLTPGEIYVTGCGIDDDYAYLVDFKVNGANFYYKVALSEFKAY